MAPHNFTHIINSMLFLWALKIFLRKTLVALLAARAVVDERQFDIALGRGVGQQVKALENKANFLPMANLNLSQVLPVASEHRYKQNGISQVKSSISSTTQMAFHMGDS